MVTKGGTKWQAREEKEHFGTYRVIHPSACY